ncbi:MAG: DUF2927 domain-containing protein [Rhodospirillaceae bacterium]|nr:DUF2927 domain-containing protein [Rhodospirillaceae bacterium]MBT6117782.1 DUF2927 domain-containing protein [Rhodospirillaceae bacterium]
MTSPRQIRRSLYLRPVLLVLALVLAACAPKIDHLSNAQIVDHFETVAFGREFATTSDHLIKWTEPVRIQLIGDDIADRHRARIVAHLADLAAITGHPIGLIEGAGEANVLLLVTPRRQFVPILTEAIGRREVAERIVRSMTGNACIGSLGSGESGEIDAAVVLIPNDEYNDLLMRACIVEELTQLLGLLNDSDEIAPSIFNDRSRFVDLTEHDRLLLRILYAPELRPGMSPEAARAAAMTALARLRPEG